MSTSMSMRMQIDTNSLYNDNINKNNHTDSEYLAFKQWLAGLIDGDGYFLLSKNGYNSCEITMDTRDKRLYTWYNINMVDLLNKSQMPMLLNINWEIK
jgi:hypothetical protein